MNIMEKLAARISELKNPTVAGLDTRIEYLPESFVRDVLPSGIHSFEDAAKAVYAYNVRLIDALCDVVPAVKVQVAYYEMYGPAGMEVYEKTIRYAQEKGLIVMADVKRNDIGATAACYANAYIGKTDMPDGAQAAFGADIATINPYLGVDGVKPFADACRENGTGVFVLVKTSNPSSGQLQDLRFEDGRTLYQAVADLVEEWGEETRGESGYSAVGAVVGATYPQQGVELRERMPHAFFLVPGYGAQGAKGTDIAGCFDANGNGAIVNASRSILCAWKKREGMAFDAAARDEALRMKQDLCDSLAAVGKAIKSGGRRHAGYSRARPFLRDDGAGSGAHHSLRAGYRGAGEGRAIHPHPRAGQRPCAAPSHQPDGGGCGGGHADAGDSAQGRGHADALRLQAGGDDPRARPAGHGL